MVVASICYFEWTCTVDIAYTEAPMLVDYKHFSGIGVRHRLANKIPNGGFAINRLEKNAIGQLE
jgi:hypothetical protein